MDTLTSFRKRALTASAAIAIAFFFANSTTFAQAYVLDDGSSENDVGLTNGGSFIALSSFAVLPGFNTITSISIAWGTPAFPDPSLIGLTYTAVLWSDPNNDGDPTDAVVLATAPGVITSQGADVFLTSLITPTTVLTSNFFVGFVITHNAGQTPASLDQTTPVANRSFLSIGGDPNDLSGALAVENFFPGNWLIRADAIPEPSTYLLTGLGLVALIGGRRYLRRQRA